MCRWMTRTCRSKLFTVFTVPLRCTVNRLRLMRQGLEVCLYGFYGVNPYTPQSREIKTVFLMLNLSVLARVRCIFTP